MNTYTLRDDRGKEIQVEEPHMYTHFKRFLLPILGEIGMSAERIAAYDGDIDRLTGVIIAHIRDRESSLAVARREFRKLKEQREHDFELIMEHIQHQTTARQSEKVIPLKKREREEKAA